MASSKNTGSSTSGFFIDIEVLEGRGRVAAIVLSSCMKVMVLILARCIQVTLLTLLDLVETCDFHTHTELLADHQLPL